MPKFTTFNAVGAMATRVEAGRLIPAQRFQLAPGSLKTTMANVTKSDQMNTVATASSGLKMMITEARHKILTSLVMAGTSGFSNAQNVAGPIMSGSGAMVLRDRKNSKLRWVKRVFEIAGPAELTQPVFRARQAGTAIDGSDLWTADLTLPVRQVRLVATQRQIDQTLTRTPGLTFRDIPSELREATLKLPYTSADGHRVVELQGKVTPAGNAVSFTFTGDAISLAYKLLRDTDDARVELLSDYTVYEALKSETIVNPSPAPAALAVPVARIGGLRRADLSTIFGNRVRAADISTRRRADISGARRKPKHLNALFKNNRLKGRAAILAAAQSAKLATITAAPVSPPKLSFAKQRIVVNMVHTLDFRGPQSARLFVTKAVGNGQDHIIRTPPWSHTAGPIRQIEEVDLRGLNIKNALRRRLRIFASSVDVGVYHVVPSAYVLGREPETGRLQFHAEVISDPVNPESSAVRVSVGLVPEISPIEELELRAALERHIVATQPLGSEIPALTMGFPTDLGTLPELTWGDQMSQASPPVLDGRTVLLTVTTKTLGFAKILFDTLAARDRVLSASLKFNLPDDISAQSSVLVGLTRTCGPTLSAHAAGGALHIEDLVGHPQNVTSVARAGGAGQVITLPLPAPIALAAAGQNQSNLANLEDGKWIPDTIVAYPDVVTLDPQRVNVDEMVTPVIVSTSLIQGADFDGSGLQAFLIEIRLHGRAPIGVTMHADAASGFFDPQILNLSVPLTNALSAGGRILDYRITAQFDDGSSVQTDWKTQNFGANPDITLRRSDLV
ncbi:hypothetical protein [Pseudosulfitobacter sp. SM2401]|uniref:hypothetical protein n=1 Tax=Pseudosulfitobacter sp. SM2401 TaxID=3350098 RepID=UPI0036F34E13